MTTIINALKQLKSKGIEFASQAVPDVDEGGPEQLPDSAPAGSAPDSQHGAEDPDRDGTTPDRVSPSFILTVGHASHDTDDRLGDNPVENPGSAADDAVGVSDISPTAGSIDAGQECSFMASPVSDIAWEAEPWVRVEVESWKLDETAKNDGSPDDCESKLAPAAARSDDSEVLNEASPPDDSPAVDDVKRVSDSDFVDESEAVHQPPVTEHRDESHEPELGLEADVQRQLEALDQPEATEHRDESHEPELGLEADVQRQLEALDQPEATEHRDESHEPELGLEADVQRQLEALDQPPIDEPRDESHEPELGLEADVQRQLEALDQPEATEHRDESHEPELGLEADVQRQLEALDQPEATEHRDESHEPELGLEADVQRQLEALDQPEATEHRDESHEPELGLEADVQLQLEAVDQPPIDEPRDESHEPELGLEADVQRELEALDQPPIDEPRDESHAPELGLEADVQRELGALDQPTVTEPLYGFQKPELVCESDPGGQPVASDQASITVPLPGRHQTELVSDPKLDDELEALDQALASEQLPDPPGVQSELNPPELAAPSAGVSQPVVTVPLDHQLGVGSTDEGRLGKTEPVEPDSLWPETPDADWPRESSSDLESRPEGNESAELDPDTNAQTREETVAIVPDDDVLDFAAVPRVRIEQLRDLDPDVENRLAEEPLFEPGIRDIDGSSGLDLTSDVNPNSDVTHASDGTLDESSAEISTEREQTADSQPTAERDPLGDATNEPSSVEEANDPFSTQLVDLPSVELGHQPPVDGDDRPAAGADDLAAGADDPTDQDQPTTDQDQPTEGSDHVESDTPVGDVNGKLGAYEQSILDRLSDESVAEQYAQSLHRMIEAVPSGLPAVVLMVGVGPESDVSETLAHMAMLLVQRDAGRVLLVDANQPGRTLSAQFSVDSRPGLSEACRGETPWQELLVSGRDTNLSILPAGTRSISPMTGPSLVKQLVDGWKNDSQIVLVDAGDIDSPLTEALAGACDSVYILIRLGRTKRDQAQAAVARLSSMTASRPGCIVTDVDMVTDVDRLPDDDTAARL